MRVCQNVKKNRAMKHIRRKLKTVVIHLSVPSAHVHQDSKKNQAMLKSDPQAGEPAPKRKSGHQSPPPPQPFRATSMPKNTSTERSGKNLAKKTVWQAEKKTQRKKTQR